MHTSIASKPRWQRLGLAFNRQFEQHMMIFIPGSLLIGFIFHSIFSGWGPAVPWLFGYITFIMGLDCNVRQIVNTLRQALPMLLLILLAHGMAPWLAYELGSLLFGADSPYVIGLVLFTVIPLGVSSVLWVSMSGGNVPLTLSLIVIDSMLSPIIVPWLIDLYFGSLIVFDTWGVMLDLLLIIVIPTLLGVAVNELTKGTAKPRYGPALLPVSKVAFALVVLINAAVIAPSVMLFKSDLLLLLPAAMLLIASGYVLGWLCAKPFKSAGLAEALSYSGGMRNISLGLVIGVAYFEPKAAVPVVLTIMLQQPTATLVYKILTRANRSTKHTKNEMSA